MSNGEGVISDETVSEDLSVACFCFFRLSEIVAEVAFNQLFAGKASHPLGGFVDIRNLSVSIDGDEGIETCFD